ncbi:MAG: tetratricopeptide repeat protein [Pseudomonadota bacterium]
MLRHLLTCLTLCLSAALPATAQFGPDEPTPKTTQERYAERAMANAAQFSGTTENIVASPEDGLDPERMQFWFDQARGVYEPLCEDRTTAKDLWSRNCFRLADMYRRGVGVEQDYKVATRLYLAACEQGDNLDACLAQAYIDHSGKGGERNWTRARSLYEAACDQDSAIGCAGLGNMVYRGQGGITNRRRGASLLRQACNDDYAWACERLDGFGLPSGR